MATPDIKRDMRRIRFSDVLRDTLTGHFDGMNRAVASEGVVDVSEISEISKLTVDKIVADSEMAYFGNAVDPAKGDYLRALDEMLRDQYPLWGERYGFYSLFVRRTQRYPAPIEALTGRFSTEFQTYKMNKVALGEVIAETVLDDLIEVSNSAFEPANPFGDFYIVALAGKFQKPLEPVASGGIFGQPLLKFLIENVVLKVDAKRIHNTAKRQLAGFPDLYLPNTDVTVGAVVAMLRHPDAPSYQTRLRKLVEPFMSQ